MANHTANWEDEENNRIVQLSVEYQLADSGIEIESVTPTSILFIDAATKSPLRRVGVWTEKGRQLLRRKYMAHVGMESLESQLESDLAILG